MDAQRTIKQAKEILQSTKHAMTVIRYFHEGGKYNYFVITIEDNYLRILLLPYGPIIHNWTWLIDVANNNILNPAVATLRKDLTQEDGLPAARASRPDHLMSTETLSGAMKDLGLLLEEAKAALELELYFNKAREIQEKSKTITFRYLWTIFPPGELVYSLTSFIGKLQVFIVRENNEDALSHSKTGKPYWTLDCWTYDWDGSFFNRVPKDQPDDKDIEDGSQGKKTTRQTLIERGKRYVELCLKARGKRIFDYDGEALSREEDLISSMDGLSVQDLSGASSKNKTKAQMIKMDRVIVDFESYWQHGPVFRSFPPMGDIVYLDDGDGACTCNSCRENEKLRLNQKASYDLARSTHGWEDEQYLICPPRVLGYHLDGKIWVELAVDNVKTIEHLQDSTAFDSLQLKKEQKTLIKALVKNHTSVTNKNPSMRDHMQGKGKGLVILLHGPPGVGKTLTAESVAKATGKPLFAVGVSEIGLKPTEVERKLEVLFELAATWQAVMLFDEADVFLESRSSNTANLNRNALVSILLRVLEYYDGILILTTNRIRTFDIAVQSRVNFAITFRDLDDAQKRTIYENFISQLTDENTADKQDLLNWIKDEEHPARNGDEPPFKLLNGRQIRNVLFSAASIAQDSVDKRLKLEHITRILKQTNIFQSDISRMYEVARKDAEVDYK
ncbi:MAG: hypothetical protein Q9164_003364 [Protoblastenia rupestris]